MYLYLSKRQRLYRKEIGLYSTFGIGVWRIPSVRPAAFLPDVSTDGRAVFRLALRCTLGQLDPRQLMDVVEDFL